MPVLPRALLLVALLAPAAALLAVGAPQGDPPRRSSTTLATPAPSSPLGDGGPAGTPAVVRSRAVWRPATAPAAAPLPPMARAWAALLSVPGRWAWPVTPRPSVVRRFDPPAQRWLPGHRGVDLRVAVGTAVTAPADGVVAFRGDVAGRPVLSIDHPGGLRSTYEAVGSPLRADDQVRRGELIGTLQAGGHCEPESCLHWGVRRGARYLDPLTLVGAAPPVLLPLR